MPRSQHIQTQGRCRKAPSLRPGAVRVRDGRRRPIPGNVERAVRPRRSPPPPTRKQRPLPQLSAGVLGMTRTTRSLGPSDWRIESIVTPAIIDMSKCFPPSAGLRSASTSSVEAGLTARTRTSDRLTTSWFAANVAIPVSPAKLARAFASGSLAEIDSGETSPDRIMPRTSAAAMRPLPMNPQRV